MFSIVLYNRDIKCVSLKYCVYLSISYTIVLFKVEEAVAVLQAHQAKQAAQVKKE